MKAILSTSYKPNFEELDKLVESGHLSRKEDGDLILYNYSDKCTFERLWNEHTINSRGTIYSKSTGEVISQAFPKFFNFSELSSEKQKLILAQTDFLTMTKMDGSMGNVFFHGDKWRVSTRGSFTSDQAIYATENLLPKYEESLLTTSKNLTFLVEIIYPENKIIVDYGPQKELITLAGFDRFNQQELPINALDWNSPFPVVDTHKSNSIEELIETVSKMSSQDEGFVVKLLNGERVKFKSPEYLRIARIMSKLSPLALWETMVKGVVSNELMESIPEEFRDVYEDFQYQLEEQYESLKDFARNHFLTTIKLAEVNGMVDDGTNMEKEQRSKLGIYLKNNPHDFNPTVWMIWNNQSEGLDKFLMKAIRPTGNIL